MKNSAVASCVNPFARASYAVVFVALAAGTMAVPASPRAALLPAAVVFGWCQIGGL